ncbi:hypothetical protein ES708_29708 [subsurface metagenome]
MAKPRSPLLSLGARGSIGDTLTFQKRGRLTIARQKPIPTDPHTDLQLAQRQVYREAVAAWKALSPAEKEAYRSVCPGLTPYQCYMKTALAYVPPVPPPEEYTEEQTQYDGSLFLDYPYAGGQHLIIPNRQVSKLGFWLIKGGSPPGTLTFQIRKWADKSILLQKLWGNCVDLPSEITYEELTFDTPTVINDDVFISATVSQVGIAADRVKVSKQGNDVKPDEVMAREDDSHNFVDYPPNDCAYRYKYYEV